MEDCDLKSAANIQNPFPAYAWLRENDPIHWSESLRAWVVTRYSDVQTIFDQPARFSSDRFRKLGTEYASERPEVKAVAEVLADWLVFRDPPDHTRLRALLQKSFTPRHLEKSREGIQRIVDRLLDALANDNRMDFISDFAFPLPAIVITILLGAPTEDAQQIKQWSDQLAAYIGGSVGEHDNFSRARDGLEKLTDYFQRLLPEVRKHPDDNLMSLMLRAEHEGNKLSEDEVVSNCVLLLFAGHETTTNLLGNGLYHLLQRPEELALLRSDPGLTPAAVEELLRFDGPVTATTKVAVEDVELRGRAIRRGDKVLAFMSAANRDPRRFEDPDRLDVRRSNNRHFAFAYGIHFCLGAPLARMEAQLAFDTLLRRLPRLEMSEPEPRFKPMLVLRGLESLSLTWT